MRRRVTQFLTVLGICWLGFAGTIFAQNNPNNHNRPNIPNNYPNNGLERTNNPNNHNRASAPEIDMGAATGALVIAAGALTLLGERLRRPSA